MTTSQNWVEFVNYSGECAGRRVMGTWSGMAGRYILPGETVHICDEFGYWRDEPPVEFLGRDTHDYRYRDHDGQIRCVTWQVVRDVIPAV